MLKNYALSLILALTILGAASAQEQKPAAPYIFHVTGQAEALPDKVLLHFSIVGDGESPVKAQEQLEQSEAAIAKVLEKYNIKQTQMHIDTYRLTPLQPSVGYEGVNNPMSLPPLGYRAQRDYTITPAMPYQSLGKIIQIADAVLQQGARPTTSLPDMARYSDGSDRQSGTILEFTVDNTDTLLKSAVDDAITRATALAAEAGKRAGTGTPHLVSLEVADSKLSTQGDYPYQGISNIPTGSPVWQPLTMTVIAEVGFGY